jgi:hypothetical protein
MTAADYLTSGGSIPEPPLFIYPAQLASEIDPLKSNASVVPHGESWLFADHGKPFPLPHPARTD